MSRRETIFLFPLRRHTVCLDICLLWLQFCDAWVLPVESICMQIFYISLRIKRLLWYMYCISPDRQGESESCSRWIYLVIVCMHLYMCVWQGGARKRGHGAVKPCVFASILIHQTHVFCPILSAPAGHRENSSICDFKPHSTVHSAPWGKRLSSLLLFVAPCSVIFGNIRINNN